MLVSMVYQNQSMEGGRIEKERETWIKVYGIPCHAWKIEFFEMLVNMVGRFVFCDDNTLKSSSLDIARFLFRTTCANMLNESFNVNFDGIIFRIIMSEDNHGPLCLALNLKSRKEGSSDSEKVWHNVDEGIVGVEEELEVFSSDSEVGKVSKDTHKVLKVSPMQSDSKVVLGNSGKSFSQKWTRKVYWEVST